MKKYKYTIGSVIFTGLVVVGMIFLAAGGVRGGSDQTASLLGNDKVIYAGPEALASANHLKLLQPSEFVIARSDKADKAGDIGNQLFYKFLHNGQEYSLPQASEGSVLTFLDNPAKVQTYVQEGSNIAIYSDLSGHNTESSAGDKIDPKLKKISNSDNVQVIIRFNLSYKNFYEQTRENVSLKNKNKDEFDGVKNHLANLINGKGKIRKDLLIINGVSADINGESLSLLEQEPSVAKVEPDVVAKVVLDTSVDEIRARETWSTNDANNNPLTGTGTRIAIIDTGVDYTHPDLGGCLGSQCKVIGGRNFLTSSTDPMDDMGHGTHVASIAAGNGLLKGVAPDAKILAYKVCDSTGSCLASNIISAIGYATDPNRDGNPSDHADVVNLSLGGYGNPDDSMSLAVDNSSAAGVVYAIAAGNSGPSLSTIASPGTARTAITVAAACKSSQVGTNGYCSNPIASFSSRGPLVWNGVDILKPDVAAPGVLICAARWSNAFPTAPTCFDSQHVRISGTSMATPHVAGAAALIRQAHPTYTPDQVKQLLKNTTRPLLGMTHNDEGTGEINLANALPNNSSISASPSPWIVTTDPTVKLSSQDQFFSVTSKDPAISTLTISVNMPVAGVSVTMDKTILNVPSSTTDSFTVHIAVDNDVAHSGTYSGSLVFTANGTTKGIIPIFIKIQPTITLSPASAVDYGVDNPNLSAWTSANQPITITNLRSDTSQSISIAPSAYPTGVVFQIPFSVNVPAGTSTIVNSNFSVNNTVLANGVYHGNVTFSSTSTATTLTNQFTKFFALIIQDNNGGDILHALAYIHDRSSSQFLINVDTNPKTIFFNSVGPYDLVIYYTTLYDSAGGHNYTVFNENISLASGSATVNVSRSNANHKVHISATNPSGLPVSALPILETQDTYTPKSLGLIRGMGASDFSTNYYSSMSANYRHDDMYDLTYQAESNLDFYYDGFTGLTSDTTFTNTASDFKKVQLNLNLNRSTGTALPLIYKCPPGLGICIAYYNIYKTLTIPIAQTINSLMPAGSYLTQTSDVLRTGCPSSGACSSAFRTPYFDVASGTRKALITDQDSFPPISGGIIYNGLGPSFWFGKFDNRPFFIRLSSEIGSLGAAFMRQDYVYQEYNAIPYTIFKDGAPFTSGNIPAMGNGSWPQLPATYTPLTGKYEFKIDSFPYYNNGVILNAKVDVTFNTALADPNPPSIKQFGYFTNNIKSEVHDSSLTNRLDFSLDPVLGNLSAVNLDMSGDGVNFLPVSITSTGINSYSANIPQVPFTKIDLRITATDDSLNSLVYTFELPAINPISDIVPPTTSIQYPTNGQSVSGVVNVQASATDNNAVAKVELYLDGKLIGTQAAAPYNFSWDTSSTAPGTHTLQTKAYDYAGNIGTSASISVVILDTISPSVTLTQPTSGATISGVITVAANASDNMGVTRVDFFRDSNVLIGSAPSFPYSISWDTGTVSTGSHIVYAKAHDASGNVGTSNNVAVTIADIIPPTTSITSPTNGSTVQRKTIVNITVSASDNVGVTKVAFYANNALLCTSIASPYSCAWNVPNQPNIKYQLQTKAYDAAGNVGLSSIITATSRQ